MKIGCLKNYSYFFISKSVSTKHPSASSEGVSSKQLSGFDPSPATGSRWDGWDGVVGGMVGMTGATAGTVADLGRKSD